MTSSHHPLHLTKFRWTENLTCRFIQLRKEHGKMFTGRKYSAQAGWEYILHQMRKEFPTIMADVHYRVLKKKWSNLLQQYKELKNPVHGDKNKADDISWPFFAAIEEVVGNLGLSTPRRRLSYSFEDAEEEDDDDFNPQEFLSVSVGNADDKSEAVNLDCDVKPPGLPELQPLAQGPVFDIDRSPKSSKWRLQTPSRKRGAPTGESSSLLSRLPSATELTIRPVPIGSNGSSGGSSGSAGEAPAPAATAESPRKRGRDVPPPAEEGRESRLERRIVEFLEYTRRRDEENRGILMRMLEAIEDIRKAVR